MVQLETCLEWFVGFGKYGEGMIRTLSRSVFSEFSYILDNNCLSDGFSKDFFTVQGLEFYSLNNVFLIKEVFHFNNVLFFFRESCFWC